MGIRVLVTALIVTLCLLNSRQISAWSVVELVSRLSSPKSPVGKQPSARDVQENAVFTNTRPAPGAAEVDKGKFTLDRLSLNKQRYILVMYLFFVRLQYSYVYKKSEKSKPHLSNLTEKSVCRPLSVWP